MECVVREQKCERLLAPSSIPLGDFVINPYRGCRIGCAYCYAQKNKNILKRNMPWGSFVDVKVNAPHILREELKGKKIKRVLIGSTTEVYQPCENDFGLMREILAMLNAEGVRCTILTKSPLIIRDIDLLQNNPEPIIYFTVSPIPERVRKDIEPHAASFEKRKEAIERLVAAGITTHVYGNPVIPHIFDLEIFMKAFHGSVSHLAFEGINGRMIDWQYLRTFFSEEYRNIVDDMDMVFTNEDHWNMYWCELDSALRALNAHYGYSLQTFFHPFSAYFGVLDY